MHKSISCCLIYGKLAVSYVFESKELVVVAFLAINMVRNVLLQHNQSSSLSHVTVWMIVWSVYVLVFVL